MKKRLKEVLLLIFCLLTIEVHAKTIYYVKSGAGGNGSSWSNASGNIQDMINKASPGDEVWIASGTYFTSPIPDEENTGWWSSEYFNLKLGVSLFGGFKGTENSLVQREKKDRNQNGIIESWEFSNETILSGYSRGEECQWRVDDANNILEIVSDEQKMSTWILYYPEKYVTSSYPSETYISGFTITGGRSACIIESSDCFVISDCEICYNGGGPKILELNKEGSDFKSGIKNSSIHHNLGPIIACNGDFLENNVIHHNQAISSYNNNSYIVYEFVSINNSKIYANVVNQWYNFVIYVNTCDNCEIYNNLAEKTLYCNTTHNSEIYNNSGIGVTPEIAHNCRIYENKGDGVNLGTSYNCDVYNNGGYGMRATTAYNCHIYGNKGGGTYLSNLYDCIIENNTTEKDGGGANGGSLYNCTIRNNFAAGNGGGISDASLDNCIIHNNFAVGNGGGSSNAYLKNCKIYNNETLNNGGGIYIGSLRECSIFNNKAGTEGGGVYNGDYYNCEIYNNYASSLGGIGGFGDYVNCTIANNKTFSGTDNTGILTNCILLGTFEGNASYSAFTDSYIRGDGNFLATEKELKLVKSTSFLGNASNDKQLEELKNADFRLSQGSSAIDMGLERFGAILPIEDKSGYPRPMGKKTDIGAHEYLSFQTLPYENKFDESSLSMNSSDRWRNGKLPGKEGYYLYYDGELSSLDYDLEYVTTPFFDKTVSNKINLSFDVAGKYRTKDQQEKMHIILAYLDSDKRDTIMTYSNTDYIQDLHFSKEISSWVKNKVFRVLFAVKDIIKPDYYDKSIIYCGISNLKISKQDASVEIVANDQVCMYDGKPHAVDFQINDTRVDKNKVIVAYRKQGETTTTITPPINAGIYQVDIILEDGSYFGMQSVKLTIEKANQSIQWSQQLRTIKAKEKMQLEATATSGLPVSFSSEDETIAKVETMNGKWWLIADSLPGTVTIKAVQAGNENYNLANSVLKTIRVEAIPTGITSISTDKTIAQFVKTENCISVKNITHNSELHLYDSLGHLCIVEEADNTEMQLPVDKLNRGIYYLFIIDKYKKESFKILIY